MGRGRRHARGGDGAAGERGAGEVVASAELDARAALLEQRGEQRALGLVRAVLPETGTGSARRNGRAPTRLSTRESCVSVVVAWGVVKAGDVSGTGHRSVAMGGGELARIEERLLYRALSRVSLTVSSFLT